MRTIEVPIPFDFTDCKGLNAIAARQVAYLDLCKWIEEFAEEQRAQGHLVIVQTQPNNHLSERLECKVVFQDPKIACLFKLSLPPMTK